MISVVIPAYNEQEVIAESYRQLTDAMVAIGDPYELVFVDDGSRDHTLPILYEIAQGDPCVRVVSFSRNFGHQIAVSAGLDYAKGDAVVIIDADLQDPPEVIAQMVEKWKQGTEVVYGVRLKREGESWFKKFTAKVFYRIMSSLSNHQIPVDTGDFRLIDRKVVDALSAMPERARFLRGMVPWAGFKQEPISYYRQERWAGETKYPLAKMLKLAYDGICSFSVKPLKLSGIGALLLFLAAIIYFLVDIILVATGTALEAIHWVAPAMSLVLSFVLVCIYFIGEYLGRIYFETQGRPLYIVDRTFNVEKRAMR